MLHTFLSLQLTPQAHRTLKTSSKPASTTKAKHSIPAFNPTRKAPSPQSQSQTSPASRTPNLKSSNTVVGSQTIPSGLHGRVPPNPKFDRRSPEYRAAARRITLAMCAAPIVIVTGYHLAMRIWGGAKQKSFDRSEKQDA